MRPKSPALARSWIMLAAALLVALPSGTAVAATPDTSTALPHPVGGYLSGGAYAAAGSGTAYASEVLPASVDLRAYAPPVGDQGQIGSCVAWSIAHGIMGYWANRTNGAGAPYAPLFLYMRNVAPGGAPSAGLYPDAVLANASTAGVDTQDDYWQGTTNYQAAPTAAQVANATHYKVSGWSRLFNGANQGPAAQTSIMQAMASGNPVALGFPVYRDFMSLRAHTVYNTVTGTSLGGHMVAAFGYDAQGVYIRNSWGTGWGNSGDAKVSWAFITKVVNGAYSVSGISTPATPVAVPPTVAALSTVKARAGTSVTITGAGLSTATAVRFGTDSASFTTTTIGGATKLVAVAPAHALGAVDVTVTNPSGTSAPGAASTFTYIPPGPAVTSLSPSSISTIGGTPVTLTGTDLLGVTAVKVGTTSVPAKTVTATSLTFTPPARAAGTAAVTVTNAYGTSTASQLSFVVPPAPVVQSIVPGTGSTLRTTPVVVTGTDFAGTTKVTLGGVAVAFTKVSGTQLKLTLPKHAAGAVTVQVTAPGGVSTVSNAATFTYQVPPPPSVAAVAPATGRTNVRTSVVVTGTNLGDATKLLVGGVSVAFTKVSATQVKAILPVHVAGTVDVQVVTPAGTSAAGSDTTFGYVAPPPPVITSLSTVSALTTVITPLIITGTGFTGATKVTVGGTAVAFSRVSDTQLKLSLPRRAAGSAPIVVVGPGGTSAAATFAYAAPAPVSALPLSRFVSTV